ncbi:MAG: ABC transporter ATP-binding protein, partial [Gammaproteobacteria bacterium]
MTDTHFPPSLLEVEAIEVRYGAVTVVQALNCQLGQGRIGCLLGPSGCGKTTVLRAIAGFEPVTAGEIRLGGRVVSRSGWVVPPERRQVGMVFQDFALFPHLTIAANVGFGIRDLSAAQRDARVNELLELVGLGAYAKVYPHQLSGGQQQRVALARAIAPRPSLLLMDEPFSSMDVELREQLAREVRGILRHEGITAVLVTHDQLEAFVMADEIGVMHGGRLEQWGSAYDLYHRPASRFVA